MKDGHRDEQEGPGKQAEANGGEAAAGEQTEATGSGTRKGAVEDETGTGGEEIERKVKQLFVLIADG